MRDQVKLPLSSLVVTLTQMVFADLLSSYAFTPGVLGGLTSRPSYPCVFPWRGDSPISSET